MRFTHFFILLYFLVVSGCKHSNPQLTQIKGEQIAITDSLDYDTEIVAFIKPYRDNIQKDLDSVLAYSADTYSKTDGELNTAIGNFMADAIYNEANPIFKKRTGKNIDMVLLNYGGIRSILPKGKVSKRTAFNLMPFENSIVVVGLKGKQVNYMIDYLRKGKSAHPISKLKLTIDSHFEVVEAKINGKEIIEDSTYFVATNDYLYNGGDNMAFFKPNDSIFKLDYKIRNALIDNFIKTDTISPVQDDRFTQIN